MKKSNILILNSFLVILSSCYSTSIVNKQTLSTKDEIKTESTPKIEVNKKYFSLKETELDLKVNEVFDLKELIVFSDSNIKENIQYLVLDKEKISIEGSKITAIKDGSTKIEISYKNTKLLLEINVDRNISVVKESPKVEEFINDTFKEKFFLRGKVYDIYNNPIEGVTVDAISIDEKFKWKAKTQVSNKDGYFEFGDSPVGARILSTAKKEGWTTRYMSQVFSFNLEREEEYSFFKFEEYNAMQDEPEINSIKINGRFFTGSGKRLEYDEVPYLDITPNLILDKNKISIEVEFSEPISKIDFENNFRILSGVFSRDGVIKRFFTHLKKEDFVFNWQKDRLKVNIDINKSLLCNKEGKESSFKIEIPNFSLVDDNGKNALPHNINNYLGTIRFQSKTTADNVIFTIKNDIEPPKLLSVKAKSNVNSFDIIELYFSEPLEVIGLKSPFAILNYDESGFNSIDGELMILSTNNKNVYSIAQVESDLDGLSFKNVGLKGSLKNISIEKDRVILYLSENTLIKGKTLVASIGKVPEINGIEFKEILFEQLQDPAGNNILIDKGSYIKNIKVNSVQNFSIVD